MSASAGATLGASRPWRWDGGADLWGEPRRVPVVWRARLARVGAGEQWSRQLRALRTVMVCSTNCRMGVFVRRASELPLPKNNTAPGDRRLLWSSGEDELVSRRDPRCGGRRARRVVEGGKSAVGRGER